MLYSRFARKARTLILLLGFPAYPLYANAELTAVRRPLIGR